MKMLTKDDLHLMGSAGNIDALQGLMKKNLYWEEVNITESTDHESRLGKCYDVANGNGRVENLVIIYSKKGRWSLYRMESEV